MDMLHGRGPQHPHPCGAVDQHRRRTLAAQALAMRRRFAPAIVAANVAVAAIVVVTGSVCVDAAGGTSLAKSQWSPASPSLHLFFDLQGLASVSGLQLKQHKPVKPPSGEFVIASENPWEPLVFAYDSVVQVRTQQA
jgi:hypothetical protein